jgi:hypothetical protein
MSLSDKLSSRRNLTKLTGESINAHTRVRSNTCTFTIANHRIVSSNVVADGELTGRSSETGVAGTCVLSDTNAISEASSGISSRNAKARKWRNELALITRKTNVA